jgi:hypothetical protein
MVKPVAAQDAVSALYMPVVSIGDENEPEPQPGGPSSEALIESARQVGTLDDESALLLATSVCLWDTVAMTATPRRCRRAHCRVDFGDQQPRVEGSQA